MDRFVTRQNKLINNNDQGHQGMDTMSEQSDDQETPSLSSMLSPNLMESNMTTNTNIRVSADISQQAEPEHLESHEENLAITAISGTNDQDNQVKRKRKYHTINVEKICHEFKWIDNTKEFLFCKVCNTKLNGSRFHLKRHENNSNHKKNIMSVNSSQDLRLLLGDDNKKKMLSQQIKTAEIKLCCFICEENLSLLLMDKLPTFNKEIYPDSQIAQGVSMKRGKATKIITGILGPAFRREVIDELKTTHFSIIIDETTDISVKKSLVIVVRYWSEEHQKVVDRFIDLVEVDTCTSEALFSILKTFLDENNISPKNIIGFASDNANVMMGSIKGVRARLKEIAPHIYVQGCSCHSLHLCSSAAALKLPNSVEQFVRDIYSYFSHSSKRISELKECQIFADEKPHKLLYPSQTRWLSLKAVVDRILEHWNSLRLFFQRAALEDNLPTAKTILNALENNIYKVYLLFLTYTLEIINKLNVEFQSETPKVPVLLNRMSALYKIFLRSFIKKTILVDDTKHFIEININDPSLYKTLDEIYLGAKLDAFLQSDGINCSRDDVHNFKLRALDYYIEFCNQVKKRFNFRDKYLELASFFAPSIAKSGNVMSVANFINLYPNVNINIESANAEWQLLPEYTELNEDMDINEFWKKVNKTKNTNGHLMFLNLMKIAKVILALPHSSATAERVFSQLALIKTCLRNRLLIKTVAAILHVKDKMKYIQNGAKDFQPNIDLFKYNSNSLEKIEVE